MMRNIMLLRCYYITYYNGSKIKTSFLEFVLFYCFVKPVFVFEINKKKSSGKSSFLCLYTHYYTYTYKYIYYFIQSV